MCLVDVWMGMGIPWEYRGGIPWEWDSHGNGNKKHISMGMGMGMISVGVGMSKKIYGLEIPICYQIYHIIHVT